MTSTLAGEHPVLTEPPNPATPPARPTEADRESALIWTMAGRSVSEMTADAIETASRALGLALAMAELERDGVTQEVAAAMIRANGGQAAGALRKAVARVNCGTCGHPEAEHDALGECQATDAATGEPCWGICGERAAAA
jgi:hypothetical protein